MLIDVLFTVYCVNSYIAGQYSVSLSLSFQVLSTVWLVENMAEEAIL